MNQETCEKIERAGSKLKVTKTQAERAALNQRIKAQARAERRRRQLMQAAALLFCLIGSAFLVSWGLWPAQPGAEGVVRLEDGSRVYPSADADLEVTHPALDRVHVELSRGRARFVVTPNPGRVFEVQAEGVLVRVLGTVFVVEHTPGQVSVQVEHGHVQVISPQKNVVLRHDEEIHIVTNQPAPHPLPPSTPSMSPAPPPPMPSPHVVDTAPVVTTPAPALVPRPAKVSKGPEADWRLLHEKGEYAKAAKMLPLAKNLRDIQDLMQAADTMRLARRPKDALPYLEHVARRFPEDPRAPLAEFTRARLLLDEFARPAQAAAVFASISATYPQSEVAEHAHAREVEAWSKAGEPAKSRRAAQSYLSRYPKGPRSQAVRLQAQLPAED